MSGTPVTPAAAGTDPVPDQTPDELVSEILRLRDEREPDADPGDLSITVQDDMPLVEVTQRHQTIGRGSTLAAALADARDNVAAGVAYGWLGAEPLFTSEQAHAHGRELRAAMRTLQDELDRAADDPAEGDGAS